MAEEKERFEVVDRRSGAQSPPPAEPSAAAGPTDAEAAREAEEMAGAVGPTDVRAILAMTIGMLAEAAWVKMGLQLDPLTGKVERDLDQARLAIDCLGDLAQRLGAHQDERSRRELNNLLTDLRLNFVRQQQAG
ncbi:MAG: DUF1844 domain-containing protein [Armatimonadetes bacterium]|nr:DUF1844 domain-containing protein [Armatimonadota bacterium]